jgi:hypothetical protein
MAIICRKCGRDIDSIGQDNVSITPGCPICEDCAAGNGPPRVYALGADEDYDDDKNALDGY